jgi:membrane-bound lytic murein transglycosylase B
MAGANPLRSTLLIAILLLALSCGAASASAATGGTSAPSGGGTTSSGSGSSTSTKGSTGATAPQGQTGGVSPSSVRPPSAPVKPRKPKRRKKRRRRHPAPVTAPAPAPAPVPTPAPAPDPVAGIADIPARFLGLYRAAGAKYGVDWRILAAIGKNESDHGRSTAPGVLEGLNFADCCSGPMQICTVKSCSSVWQHYAVDGDGDGLASVYDPDDAIYGAAWLVHDLQAIVGPDPKLLLAAYNAGPGNVKRYDGVPPFPETKAYVRAGLVYIATLG